MNNEPLKELLNQLGNKRLPEKIQQFTDDQTDAFVQNLSQKSSPNFWRTMIKSKLTKYAAAAVIIVGVMVGLKFINGSPDGASVVWGDIIYEIVVAETATFDLIIEKNGQIIQTSHLTCKAPGLIKQVMANGDIHIVDLIKHRLLVLNANTKKAILKEDTEGLFQLSKFNLFANFQKRLKKMIHFQDETVENLGHNTIDGLEVIEFRIQLTEKDQIIGWQGKGTFTIWADTETKLPIRLEWYDEMFGVNTIADKLELNSELDESILK